MSSGGREEYVETCRQSNQAVKDHLPCAWQYLRRRKQGKVGLVLAVLMGDSAVLGWSLCNTSSGDRFDPEVGFQKAYRRALEAFQKGTGVQAPPGLPHSLRAVWGTLSARAGQWAPRGVFLSLSEHEVGGEGGEETAGS